MEVLIVKSFQDKNTLRVYKPGETVTLTKRRVNEINKTLGEGWITEALPPQEPPADDAVDPDTEDLDTEDLEDPEAE